MNQDSEQNDRSKGSNRDGGPQRREDRSFGRRDDAPRFNRNNDTDRPRFNRSGDTRNSNDRDDKPRFNRERSDRPAPRSNDRFPRGENRSEGRGRRDDSEGRPPRSERSDFGQRSEKPQFNRERNDRFSGGNRNDDRSKSPRFERNTDRFGSERRFNDQRDEKPRFNRDDRDNERPRFNRPSDGRNSNDRDDKPRFNRDERPRSDKRSEGRPDWSQRSNRPDNTNQDRPNRFSGPRNNDRPDSRPDSRRERPDSRPDFRRERNDERPSFRRDGDSLGRNDRFSREERPAFKRSDSFKRDDNRPKSRFSDDDRRGNRRRNDESSDSENSRFSPEQRKASGERRAGKFDKAPSYRQSSSDEKPAFKPKRNTEAREFDKPKRKSAEEAGLMRLNRYIANSGVCSRREADELIARGDISVNGKVVTEMGFKVKEGDNVKYGTKALSPERFVYVLLNKPKDYITTTEDPEERKTVMELVADAGNYRMYPVGRLDRNTTGLLLLTNDGELADKLTHPSYNVRKIYQVELDKPITNEHFEAIQQGIELEDGTIKPDALSIVTPDAYVVGIEIHSGRNRIVRRIFEHLGYEVSKLDRTTYAGLTKKELPRGKWRFLEPKEVIKLKYFN
ncbi:pseudouridine synthase [Spirosoma daeguense]